MEEYYSMIFNQNCERYPHYLDVVKGSLGVEDTESPFLQSDTLHHHCAHCFTALEEDLFNPKGFHSDNSNKPVVFDSGCTISITPFKEDFVGESHQ